jgi:hypothetical protein
MAMSAYKWTQRTKFEPYRHFLIAQKLLDLQMLFVPFEEQFHLLSTLVRILAIVTGDSGGS